MEYPEMRKFYVENTRCVNFAWKINLRCVNFPWKNTKSVKCSWKFRDAKISYGKIEIRKCDMERKDR